MRSFLKQTSPHIPEVFEYVQREKVAGIRELENEFQLNRSNLYRCLRPLREAGLIEFTLDSPNSKNQRYTPTLLGENIAYQDLKNLNDLRSWDYFMDLSAVYRALEGRDSPVTVSEVAEERGKDKSSVRRELKKLVEYGYLEQKSGEKKGGVVTYYPTPKGKAELRKSNPSLHKAELRDLREIVETGSAKVKDISFKRGVNISNVRKRLNKLVSKGLLRFEREEREKTMYNFSPTDKGKRTVGYWDLALSDEIEGLGGLKEVNKLVEKLYGSGFDREGPSTSFSDFSHELFGPLPPNTYEKLEECLYRYYNIEVVAPRHVSDLLQIVQEAESALGQEGVSFLINKIDNLSASNFFLGRKIELNDPEERTLEEVAGLLEETVKESRKNNRYGFSMKLGILLAIYEKGSYEVKRYLEGRIEKAHVEKLTKSLRKGIETAQKKHSE